MKIIILDDYQHVIEKLACYKILAKQDVEIFHETEKAPQLLAKRIKDAEILILTRERTLINDELLSLLPNLKLISQTGKISNHLDLTSCSRHHVAVAEGVGSPIAPSELTWALIMNVVRQIPQAIDGMKNGRWQTNIGSTINGKTIGIWGYGKIGQRIANYAKAFGAEVLVWGSDVSRDKALQDGFGKAENKEEFFSSCDIITLHLRLTPTTFGIVKESDLKRMKSSAALINTARAELIEKDGLINALTTGSPGFAGIDVYEEEPIYDKDYRLLKMPRIVCTPHLGYVEMASYELYFGKAFENVINYINGNPTNIVNGFNKG